MKKIGTMDLILLFLGVTTLVFIAVMCWFFYLFQCVPDTLIQYYFLAITGECGIMGLIKSFKTRREDRKWQLEDQQRMKEEQAAVSARDDKGG